MLPPRTRTRGSQAGVGLALFAAALMVVVGTPWSSARAAEDNEAPKASAPDTSQVEDTDKPHDKSLLEKQPVDTAKQNQATDEAFYQKWQFWAIAGGVIGGGLLLFFGGKALYHTLNGGDVRPCNTMAFVNCYGQGEPQ